MVVSLIAGLNCTRHFQFLGCDILPKYLFAIAVAAEFGRPAAMRTNLGRFNIFFLLLV
jgi:hypothetical protein